MFFKIILSGSEPTSQIDKEVLLDNKCNEFLQTCQKEVLIKNN